ncbi:DUF6534 domain-containing protein [Sporobolomyces koalae]|uniref:DUF6534 domain-containing protein n=1 Tax=Sporobolomyces koalae TaxID=500713 RepID=UPI003176621A
MSDNMSDIIAGLIGPFLIGSVLACFLSGITSTQVVQYHLNFPNDRKLYKSLVYGLWALDLSHTALAVWSIWGWCVSEYGDIENLAMSPWSYGACQIQLGVMALVIRFFYAYRVYIVSKRKIVVPIIIVILSFGSLGMALTAATVVFTKKYFDKFHGFNDWGISVWLALAGLADAVITGSLVYYLAKSKTGGLHNTNSVLNKMIELLVSTNFLTLLIGLLSAILWWTHAGHWFIAANLCIAKFYFNSFLVSLNARVELERRLLQGSNGHGESHGLVSLGVHSTTTKTIGGGGNNKRDMRTALGFGLEDCEGRDKVAPATRRGNGIKSLGAGIQVVTHQTVVTDAEINSGTYSPHSYMEKDLEYFANEKEGQDDGSQTPVHATHFAPQVEHRI